MINLRHSMKWHVAYSMCNFDFRKFYFLMYEYYLGDNCAFNNEDGFINLTKEKF